MLPEQFYAMTWGDYNRYAVHKLKSNAEEWERTREIVTIIYNTNCTNKSQQKKSTQLFPLFTDRLRNSIASAPAKLKLRRSKEEVIKHLMKGK